MSLADDLRKRLDALNRRPLPPGASPRVTESGHARKGEVRDQGRRRPARSPSSAAIVYRRDLPRLEPGAMPARPPDRPHLLTDAVNGEEAAAPEGGRAFLVTHPLRELSEEAAALAESLSAALSRERSNLRRWVAATCGRREFSPADVMFVDIETTGLGATPLFLIGTMSWECDGLVVRQFFARHYGEEPAVISLFLGQAARKRLLVSFNGKSFDLPYVRVRAAANAIPFTLDADHLDLLHVSRRIWRGKLPDCRLQTIERCVCGRLRFGDISSSQIPQAYHDFVRTADASVMAEVLRHNMLDLLTLADLMVRLPAPATAS